MDLDQSSSASRKHRFAPKTPSTRKTRSSSVPKTEKADSKEDDEAKKQLLQRFNELGTHRQRRLKAEKNAPVQPTFIHGAKQSGLSGTYRESIVPRDGGLKRSEESDLMDLDDSTTQSVSTLSAVGPSVVKESPDDSVPKSKEYREPWDYARTYYPTTLPLRRPYSGDPEILDEAEFGEAATKLEFNENATSPAAELGFLNPDESSENVRLLFLQLPRTLPAVKRSATAKGKEIAGSSGPLDHKGPTPMNRLAQRSCSLDDLSSGQMGKLLVYKSGAVKLKLGEVFYDVSAGENCSFAQEVVALNTQEKECCSIGNLDKRAVVTPDTNSLLESVIDLG